MYGNIRSVEHGLELLVVQTTEQFPADGQVDVEPADHRVRRLHERVLVVLQAWIFGGLAEESWESFAFILT